MVNHSERSFIVSVHVLLITREPLTERLPLPKMEIHHITHNQKINQDSPTTKFSTLRTTRIIAESHRYGHSTPNSINATLPKSRSAALERESKNRLVIPNAWSSAKYVVVAKNTAPPA